MKQITTIFFLCLSITIFSQANFQGKAVYESKTTMNSDFGGRDMSEERKKQIMQRMKSMLEKTFILSFTREESVYKEQEKLAAPTTGRGRRFGGFSGGGIKYKNVKEGTLLESTEAFGKKFLISEAAEKPNWELGSETKQIGNYTCYKATLVKKNTAFNWRSMRRPRRNEAKKDSTKVKKELELPKETIVTAWYTPQVPVSNGPGNYWGLPGLILEINEGRTTVLCSEITMNPSEKIEITKPEKGKKVTRKEYTEIMKVKMEEMRERFSGGRRSGGRGGRF
ncbi:GLPGLI family protein [Tenacibaculum haliotis]|uniref:GLPGLI family protein n=1 Tax=Tenacibaculum haliotis TaxID=1888914 RepID=UPI0021AFBC1A|nr:GLPGLI family protein [Tenacibaculum haliotis]MCT4699190.1 GLPGLI family protein [Tenacibaculum haliotis]